MDGPREDDAAPVAQVTRVPMPAGRARSGPLRNPMLAYLGSLSPNGARAMRERLRAVALLLGIEPVAGQRPEDALQEEWHQLAFQELEFIRGRLLARGYAPSTINLTLAALKGIARYARDLGLTSAEEHDRIRRVRGARGTRVPPGRAIAGDELAALAAACAVDDGPAGARDLALLATLRVGGVRRAELAALALGDYRPGDPPLLVVQRGKGDKGREIPLNAAAAAALAAWLGRRGPGPGALFTRIDRWGNVDARCRPLSTQAVYAIVEKRVAEAAVAALSPHDFRRTFVGDILDAGHDLATAQKLAGHASPVTTARYDRRGERAKARATADLHFPLPSARDHGEGEDR